MADLVSGESLTEVNVRESGESSIAEVAEYLRETKGDKVTPLAKYMKVSLKEASPKSHSHGPSEGSITPQGEIMAKGPILKNGVRERTPGFHTSSIQSVKNDKPGSS